VGLGTISFIFGIVAIATEGWWQAENAKHGLWTATKDGNAQAIFIGQDIGYKVIYII